MNIFMFGIITLWKHMFYQLQPHLFPQPPPVFLSCSRSLETFSAWLIVFASLFYCTIIIVHCYCLYHCFFNVQIVSDWKIGSILLLFLCHLWWGVYNISYLTHSPWLIYSIEFIVELPSAMTMQCVVYQ